MAESRVVLVDNGDNGLKRVVLKVDLCVSDSSGERFDPKSAVCRHVSTLACANDRRRPSLAVLYHPEVFDVFWCVDAERWRMIVCRGKTESRFVAIFEENQGQRGGIVVPIECSDVVTRTVAEYPFYLTASGGARVQE